MIEVAEISIIEGARIDLLLIDALLEVNNIPEIEDPYMNFIDVDRKVVHVTARNPLRQVSNLLKPLRMMSVVAI